MSDDDDHCGDHPDQPQQSEQAPPPDLSAAILPPRLALGAAVVLPALVFEVVGHPQRRSSYVER